MVETEIREVVENNTKALNNLSISLDKGFEKIGTKIDCLAEKIISGYEKFSDKITYLMGELAVIIALLIALIGIMSLR
ncbi:MAG: hypothetical protein QME47_06950 [Candidatus Thermoplasmatota archaeon]|nr:hypothetical protein [Candidatus Thermoplasmatota archaeon]